jgi:AAA ATPase domain
MAMGELKDPDGALIGRERECSEIESLVGDAVRGASGSLVVRGEPGVGKTTLLEHAAACADGMIVLRTTGVDAESNLVFAGLYGLVRPVADRLGQRFEPQARALEGGWGSRRRELRIGSSCRRGCLACSRLLRRIDPSYV